MNAKSTLLAVAVLALGGTALSATASTTTANLPVTITIQNACNVTATAPTTLNFGTQGPLTSAVNATSTITLTCTTGDAYNIGLNGGASGNINARTMANGSSTVGYQLYSNSAMTTVWGNTVGTNTVTGTGNGTQQTYTVYGQVPAQTTPAQGVYNDTVTVTVTY